MEQKLDPIGSPEVAITKLAPGNALHFTLTVSLVPEIILPDYKKIAKRENEKKESVEVTEKDVAEAIEHILRQKMAYERIQKKAAKRKEDAESGVTLPTPDTVEEPAEDFSKLPLPELTDNVAKTLGNFTTVAEFKDEIKKHLGSEKEKEAKGKHRAAVTDAIIEEVEIDLPEIFIESELAQMFGEMESDITRAGLKMEDYLEHIKKTRDDLKNEWTPVAEKRAKLQLSLNEIAKKENVVADTDAIEREVAAIVKQYKDVDPMRVRIYVESTLRNEATMAMLEAMT